MTKESRKNEYGEKIRYCKHTEHLQTLAALSLSLLQGLRLVSMFFMRKFKSVYIFILAGTSYTRDTSIERQRNATGTASSSIN